MTAFDFTTEGRKSKFLNANHLHLDKRIMKKGIWSTVFLLLSLVSCTKEDNSKTIYASFYPIYDFAQRIVGDKFVVKNLTPPGSEPHDYEPTAKEVAGMIDSPLLLLNGLGLDHWTESMPRELKEKAFVVTEGIDTLSINGVVDPHVWLSVKNAATELTNIYERIVELDPSNVSYYKTNYESAYADLVALDDEFKEATKNLSHKYLVVSHAAFGYLCDEYGFTQYYLSGLEPDSAPTAKTKERIVELIKEYQISTIFYEEYVGSDIADSLAEETGIKVDVLNPLEGLSQIELEQGEDYISVMRNNLEKIVRSCQ